MSESTMKVKVNGRPERRKIAYVMKERSTIAGEAPKPPLPYPVHADHEMVFQTISGETFIIKA